MSAASANAEILMNQIRQQRGELANMGNAMLSLLDQRLAPVLKRIEDLQQRVAAVEAQCFSKPFESPEERERFIREAAVNLKKRLSQHEE